MQQGCMEKLNRKRGPEVWQFRWSVSGPDGKRLYRKKTISTVERYPDENAARRSVIGLVSGINIDSNSAKFKVMQELRRHSTLRSTLDVYTQAVTPAKHAAQAAVVWLVFSSGASGGELFAEPKTAIT